MVARAARARSADLRVRRSTQLQQGSGTARGQLAAMGSQALHGSSATWRHFPAKRRHVCRAGLFFGAARGKQLRARRRSRRLNGGTGTGGWRNLRHGRQNESEEKAGGKKGAHRWPRFPDGFTAFHHGATIGGEQQSAIRDLRLRRCHAGDGRPRCTTTDRAPTRESDGVPGTAGETPAVPGT